MMRPNIKWNHCNVKVKSLHCIQKNKQQNFILKQEKSVVIKCHWNMLDVFTNLEMLLFTSFFVNLVNQFDFSDKLLTLQDMWIVYSVCMFFVKIF